MFRSLQMKLVLVLVMLVISVMAVVGIFLLNAIAARDTQDFLEQMNEVFTPEFILSLEQTASGGAEDVRDMMNAYSAQMGIDKNRMFFVLDGVSGEYLAGSDEPWGASLRLTPNMISALSGRVGQTSDRLSDSLDIALPLRDDDGKVLLVVGVTDNKTEINTLTWNILTMLIRAIFFALVVALLLSFLLSKTITTPVEKLTEQAASIASGDLSRRAEVSSTDELGELCETFNEMADTLEHTLREVGEARNKLDTLFKHMADGVVAFGGDGKLLHVNPAARDMLGRDIKDDMTYAEVFPNTVFHADDLREDGHFMELDYVAGARVLKMFLAPLTGQEENQGVMVVLHDITAQQKLEESRREFVANVSHELRTPLTNIKGYTETLIDGGEMLDEETRRSFLDVVYNESDRMTRIVKDLLTLSRLDNQRMEMNMESMDLIPVVKAAVQSMMLEAENQNITLTSHLPDSLPLVNGDKERLHQVVLNIISNAVKYNRPEGSVSVTADSDEKTVTVTVSDTGLGIPAEDLPRIFERFYRVDKARSRKRGGTGLGLAIAKEIVESHGGEIVFDSVYGQGSTVYLRFPVLDTEQAEEQA